MELKEGMYVRTKEGITQVWKVYEPFFLDTKYKQIYNEEIIKASNNITDLIEEDDLIKCQFGEQTLILQVGARYTTSHQVNDWVKGVFTLDNDFWSLKFLDEEDILQSIVTKEQFESMSYKL